MSINAVARAFSVSTTDRNLTAHAGAVLIRAAAEAVGLGTLIARRLHLKKRARGLTEGQSIVAMAEAVALGARCLDDLAIARADGAQEDLRGFAVPAPQTAGSFLKRFTLGHLRQLDKGLRAVHLRAFELLGIRSDDSVTLDFDSTYIRSYSSRREGADPTWTKRYTLHPLLCFVAEFKTCLHAKLRRGKSPTSRGIASFVVECLRRIPEGVGVRARFDSGFYSSDLFADLEDRSVTFLCVCTTATATNSGSIGSGLALLHRPGDGRRKRRQEGPRGSSDRQTCRWQIHRAWSGETLQMKLAACGFRTGPRI